MGRGKRYTSEQIITKLREAEVLQSQGLSQAQICKQLGIGLKRYKDLEKENERLKKIVANLSLDNAMLKEVNKGNF